MKLFRVEKMVVNCGDFSAGARWVFLEDGDDLSQLEARILDRGAEAHGIQHVYSTPTNGRNTFEMFRIVPSISRPE